ncbi:hypothetical protein OSB04_017173 [Centaurea solstitialis]|uniref:Reverse transcriptase domain-containing protein n=1 Tax=Centaurea solstitialis TaxID=347529 RepID=A0AA38T9Z7_9ASTR|nr:hypothetical protein OSB04_017173 [Centaurea solstitialis]
MLKYLGGKHILIHVEGEETIREVESNSRHGIHFWVKILHRWSVGYKEVERITWLKISRIPLHGWKEEIFTKIANRWRQVLKSRNCNLFDDMVLNEGRIQICTPIRTPIQELGYIKVDNLFYRIVICEDTDSSMLLDFQDSQKGKSEGEDSDRELPESESEWSTKSEGSFVNDTGEAEKGFNSNDQNCVKDQHYGPRKANGQGNPDGMNGLAVHAVVSRKIDGLEENDGTTFEDNPAIQRVGTEASNAKEGLLAEHEVKSGPTQKEMDNIPNSKPNKPIEKSPISLGVRILLEKRVGQGAGFKSKSRHSRVTGNEIKKWDVSHLKSLYGGKLSGSASVAATGNSGGILTVWDGSKFDCSQVFENKNFLITLGKWAGIDGTMGFVNVNGPNTVAERKELWANLLTVLANEEIKWCCFGDFNEVRIEGERLNSTSTQRGMDDFNGFIEEGGLLEIPLAGRKFTRISDDGMKFSKLDRFLMTTNFGLCWKNLGMKVIDRNGSYHIPGVFRSGGEGGVESSISFIGAGSNLRDKLKQVKLKIKEWSKINFGAIDKKIIDARNSCNRMELKAEEAGWNDIERDCWLKSRKEWLELEEKKSDMGRQKAKLKWMAEGDENSKFFHMAVKNQERKNSLRGLEINGEWVDDPVRVSSFVFDFFQNKFLKRTGEFPIFSSSKTKTISSDEAEQLESPFGEEEVWQAIKDCGNNKSSGPDGFTFGFVKRFWGILKGVFMNAMRWFWEKESMGPGCNSFFLTLIPKVTNPSNIGDFRPISLIGVFYKVVAKVLAQRLKKVIGKVISESQSAFIKGRNILDVVLIANEVIDFVRNEKKKGLIFKVDFEKAYDSVDWDFLLETLKRMGFRNKWIGWINACLRSSHVSVLVNGSPSKEFIMGRGLRQGDPMAPFLFLIEAENLNLLLEEAKEKGLYEGLKIGTEGTEISHLQYADDAIFFGKWCLRNLKNLLKILDCFREISGLRINLRKSRIFGLGVQDAEIQGWARGVGCEGENLPFKYLGVPVGASMHRLNEWKPVVEKLRAKLSSWKAKAISFGGRLRLTKSVLGSSPLYFLSLFRSPSGVLSELERIRKNFFWGGGR